MSIFEAPQSTWEKRFMQKHYSYRDSHASLTLPAPTLAFATYTFGTNARAISVFNWPNLGDYASGTVGPRGQCYAAASILALIGFPALEGIDPISAKIDAAA